MIFKKDLKLGLRDLEVYVNDKDIEIFLRKFSNGKDFLKFYHYI